jgi:hypothetical protein
MASPSLFASFACPGVLQVRSVQSPPRRRPFTRGFVLHGSSLALGLVLLACGGRTPLGALGSESFVAGDDASLDATGPSNVPDVVEAAPDSDPCAGMPPVPCPGGGYQYCANGHYGECPKLCGLCVPGSTRVCFMTYCWRWGTQTCAADGLSFGFCQEHAPPSQCSSIAGEYGASPELEQCCIDNGYCCEDRFDLNGDGNTGDQIGRCTATSC